jgi:uracil-DNA glycosylase
VDPTGNAVTSGERPRGLSEIASAVAACRACPRLVAWRESVGAERRAAYADDDYWARPLPGFGDPDAGLVIVGLAPAAHGANRTGRVFTGDRSGDFLFAALHRAGFSNQATSTGLEDGLALSGAFITAAVRCAPPGNRPTPAERDACAGFLEEEFSALGSARVVLALGAFALDAVWRLGPTGAARPRFAHGLEVPFPGWRGMRTLLCSYHPSQRNVFTGLLNAEMFDAVLQRARELAL